MPLEVIWFADQFRASILRLPQRPLFYLFPPYSHAYLNPPATATDNSERDGDDDTW